MTDTVGRTTQFIYDGPNLVTIIDPAGRTVQFQYGEQVGWQNMLTAIVNQAGITTTLTYDEAGDLVTILDPLGNLTRLDYDALGRVVAITDALDYTTRLTYDTADRPLQITDPLSGTVEHVYDAVGNLVAVIDQIGAVTAITYTVASLPAQITDPLSGTMQIAYDSNGRPTTLTDQLGHQSTMTYDAAGRITAVTDAQGHTTHIGYDLLGNTTVITDANGHALHIEYDALSRPVVLRNALEQTISYTYDAAGNVTRITDAAGAFVSIGYDILDRPVVITDQLGITTTYQYNGLNALVESLDGNGIVTRFNYDELNQLTEVIANYRPGLPATADTNVTTRYTYDPVGNLRQISDPRNFVTHFAYDPLGRMVSATDPLSRTMSYAYDLRGLLTGWTKADETEISYTYDLAGRLQQITTPDRGLTYLYDAAGRRTGLADAEGFTEYAYDTAGRPLTITLPGGDAVSYRYDNVGNRTHLIYPDGSLVQYHYNEINQVVAVTDWDNQVTTYSYDDNGRLQQILLPNQVTTTLTYDAASNLTGLVHTTITGTIGSYLYTYDGTGRRLGVVENGRTITYTYDALYRLTQALDNSGDLYQYQYDAAGNRLLKTEPEGTTTATYDAANQLATLDGVPVLYDANGNLLDDGENSYQYNSLDQLVVLSNGGSQTLYGYHGDGDRLWQVTDGVTTTFTLDLNLALAQVLAQHQDGTTTRVLPGLGLETNGAWTYLHADALGSVRHLTGPSGQLLGDIRYSPFGEIVELNGPPALFGFTGEPQDMSSGLTYLRARYYHPALGRFLTQDSLIPDVTNGQALNAYTYVYNDPINLVDPSGNIPGLPSGDDLRTVVRKTFELGLDGLGWYFNDPDCACEGGNLAFWGPVVGVAAQGVNNIVTTPAEMYGSKVVEIRVSQQVKRFTIPLQRLKNSRFMHRHMPLIRLLIPNKISFGNKTIHSWHVVSRTQGSLKQLAEPGVSRGNGTHYTSKTRRVTFHTKTRLRPGPMGFSGAAVGAGLIDGFAQLASDWDLCMSRMQKANRFALSLLLGLAGGAAAGLAFTAAVALTAGAPFIIAASVPILVGLAVGYGAGIVSNQLKDVWFNNNPKFFGAY